MTNLNEYTIEQLQAEIERRERPFKKGDLVLVRDNNHEEWQPKFFGEHYIGTQFFKDSNSVLWEQCKPYDKTHIAWRYDVENMPEDGRKLVLTKNGSMYLAITPYCGESYAYAVLPELPEVKQNV